MQAWPTVLMMGEYVVEPSEPGPQMLQGQKFTYHAEDPRLDLMPEEWHVLSDEDKGKLMAQYEATHGEWYVQDISWLLDQEGAWVQQVSLSRANRPKAARRF